MGSFLSLCARLCHCFGVDCTDVDQWAKEESAEIWNNSSGYWGNKRAEKCSINLSNLSAVLSTCAILELGCDKAWGVFIAFLCRWNWFSRVRISNFSVFWWLMEQGESLWNKESPYGTIATSQQFAFWSNAGPMLYLDLKRAALMEHIGLYKAKKTTKGVFGDGKQISTAFKRAINCDAKMWSTRYSLDRDWSWENRKLPDNLKSKTRCYCDSETYTAQNEAYNATKPLQEASQILRIKQERTWVE